MTSRLSNDGTYFKLAVVPRAKYVCCSTDEEVGILLRASNEKLVPLLSGFPRHDSLLRKCNARSDGVKRVFVTFHWRDGLPDLLGSSYLRDINAFLSSPKLEKLHDSGVQLSFMPHAVFMPFLDMFLVPDFIDIPVNKPFQDILVESDVLVTDFSSNSFEMAYMGKPTVVYIPGIDEVVFNHKQYHLERLDYPHMTICSTVDGAIDKVGQMLHSNDKPDFAHQMFKHVDTDNTMRLVEWMYANLDNVRESQKRTCEDE